MSEDILDMNFRSEAESYATQEARNELERFNDTLELDQRRVESHDIEDSLASERARQLLQEDLEKLYFNDLDINNPPNSIEAFENRVTLRNLMTVATEYGSPASVTFEHKEIVFEFPEDLPDESGVKSFSEGVRSESEPVDESRAKKAIDRMAEYGTVAEQFLAMVAEERDIHPEVAEYALDALADIQEQPTEQQSLIETLQQWWRGGRS